MAEPNAQPDDRARQYRGHQERQRTKTIGSCMVTLQVVHGVSQVRRTSEFRARGQRNSSTHLRILPIARREIRPAVVEIQIIDSIPA
jgi:hypothetical protein